MARIETWYKQDLKRPVKVQTLMGNVFTLDNVGSLIGVEVFSDGVEETLTGAANGYCILPDGTTISVPGTRSGNKAYILLPQSVLAYPGLLKITVKLTNGNEITTLLAVIATVARSRTDAIITPSQQIITDWSQQIAAEMQAVEDASAAQDAKINDLKSALTNALDASTGNAIIEVTYKNGYLPMTGGYIDITATPTGSANFDCSVVPCSPGDVFTINAVGGSTPRAWAFIKSDGQAISPYAAGSAVCENLVLTAPSESAYLVINDKSRSVSLYGNAIKNEVKTIKEDDLPAIDTEISTLAERTENTFEATTSKPIPITSRGNYLPIVNRHIDISNPTGSANFNYSLVECSEGDIFTINAKGGASARAWVFIKANGDTISPYAEGYADVHDLMVVAPENSAYLVINDNGNRVSLYGDALKNRFNRFIENQVYHPYAFDTYFDTQREASSNWWINDYIYPAGYVNYVKTYIWGDTDQEIQVALVRANIDSGYTSASKPKFNATGKYIICKLTATGHGYVTIPVNMYIPCGFWVSIKSPAGLAYYQTRGSAYHYRASSTLFDGLEGESASWEWQPADLTTTLSYIIAAEVEYASTDDLRTNQYPVAKTINTMLCFGDSQTAGYPYQNTDSLAGVYWWNGVGRNLGYDVQQGSRSGSGWLYKSGSTNAITITNAWADRIPGFNVAVYAYGTNDYGNDIPLGTINDMWVSDSSGDQTYAGAINYVISRIYELNPKIILVLATPFNRSDVGSLSSNYGMGHPNADGHTLKDYCDMMIAICEKRGVMYVDRRTSAFNTGTMSELLGDGLHPTAYGYKVLGAEMTAKLGALIHPYFDMV